MKKTFLVILSLLLLCSLHAEDLFRQHGFNKDPLTLSKGKYPEVFNNDEVVQIGTVLLNTKTNKVVKLLEEDTVISGYKAEYSSRFLTIDPLAEKYYSISPYAYCANNPIIYVDPTGQWIESAWDVFSLGLGVNSFIANVKEGNVGGAIADGLGIVADAAAVVLPVVPGGAGAIIKGVRAGDKAIDAVKTGKNVDKAIDVKKTVKANDGISKPHGNSSHDNAINQGVQNAKDQGATNVRKNQTQVDVNGNKVGNNRPDLQYDIDGAHHNIEYDNIPANSKKHGETIKKNDPNSKIELNILKKD